MKKDQTKMDAEDILKMLQQKIGNLELTVHAMMSILEKEDLLNQAKVSEEAKAIVEEMQQSSEDDLQEELEERMRSDDR